MSFDINGYLGNQIEDIKKDIYNKYQDIFKLCEELNRFAQGIKLKFNIKQHDNQGIIAAILYIKIVNLFQGSVIMYQHGLDTEANVLIRTALETSFVLKAIIKDEKNLEILRKDFDKKREEQIGRVIADKYGTYADIKNNIDYEEYERLKKRNEEEKAKKISIFKWAQLANSVSDYNYAYNILSADVHVDLGNLCKYVGFNENEEIEYFNNLPSTDGIERSLFTAMIILLTAIDHMNDLTNIGIEDEIKMFNEKITKIGKSIK